MEKIGWMERMYKCCWYMIYNMDYENKEALIQTDKLLIILDMS